MIINKFLLQSQRTIQCLALVALISSATPVWAQEGDDQATAGAEKSAGFTSIFNGTDLSGWDGDPQFWKVTNGAIVGQTTEEVKAERNTFLLHEGEYADFELRFSYQVEKFNSGMQYRSAATEKWFVKGYQADFEARWHDDGKADKFSGMFFEENGRMFMGQRGDVVVVRSAADGEEDPQIEKIASVGDPQMLEKAIRRTGWNDYIIIARGYQFTHIINGQVMSIGFDEDKSNRKRSGAFALQLHSGPAMKIMVKNIRVRELNEDED